MTDMLETLREVPLFTEMASDELKRLTDITVRRTYKKHTIVFMEGDPREAVFFIESGVIKIVKVDENGNEQLITFLQNGDMFPQVGFFDSSPYPVTTEVIRDAVLLVIHIDDFEQLLLENPQMTLKMMKMMGQKMLSLQKRLQDLISGDVPRRVTQSLIQLAHEYGEPQENGILISLPITNRDFANMLGTSRESVNRTLNQLKKDALIDVNRQGILIYDLTTLQKIE